MCAWVAGWVGGFPPLGASILLIFREEGVLVGPRRPVENYWHLPNTEKVTALPAHPSNHQRQGVVTISSKTRNKPHKPKNLEKKSLQLGPQKNYVGTGGHVSVRERPGGYLGPGKLVWSIVL